MDFKGKNILVTGSNRGIGREIALSFARLGGNIVINGSKSINQELISELEGMGIQTYGVIGDVSNYEEAKRMISDIEENIGKIDVLVNNAGITKDELIIRMKPEEFQDVIKVNLVGTYNMTSIVVKSMLRRRTGAIINISSVVGLVGNIGQSNYAASKAGIIGFTKSIAREVAGRSITVNAIAPGFIETSMTEVLSDKIKEQAKVGIPMNKFGTARDVAEAAIFLAGANYITGQVINVDGGMVMNG
ncbi:MAG: 3-oxoacyl-[acyl-carrier-protein] reductase [Lachnospiraceae bacterium]|jgi:3-oxoacyl-[acyl-carrier protein] reductase|nr:3-oxoacyl-[acyl-carrier-protein] reductase [Lachnospiraceae bacterium]